MNSVVEYAFFDELEKIANQPGLNQIATPNYQTKRSTTDRVMSALPAAGAVAGGAHGYTHTKAFSPKALFPALKNPKFKGRAKVVSGVLGAGLGATTAWLPSAFRDAARAVKE